jgi:hypothetical protein
MRNACPQAYPGPDSCADERANEEVGVIERMPGSHDNVLGFRVSGDVTREND